MDIRIVLEEYKQVSLKLIETIENDGDDGEVLIKRREELLECLKVNGFSKDELKIISSELELVKIEEKIIKAIEFTKKNIKNEINELKRKKEANKSYGNSFNNISFINKRI